MSKTRTVIFREDDGSVPLLEKVLARMRRFGVDPEGLTRTERGDG